MSRPGTIRPALPLAVHHDVGVGWELRQARVDEACVVAELSTVVQALHHEHEPDRFKVPDPDALVPKLEEWSADSDVLVLLASDWENGEALGYLVGMVRSSPGHALLHAETVAELDQIAVIPAARQRGIGGALIEAMIAWARERGAHRIELSVWTWNQVTQGVFRKAGFEPVTHRMSLPLI
jgi:aminoglycoside 3-N-acetyltransferase I